MTVTQELFQAVCEKITEGLSLRKICKLEGMPTMSAFLWAVSNSEDMAKQYARARDIQMEVWAEECLEIADNDEKDFGFKEIKDESGESAQVFINKDNIQRARLRVDERHWQMSKQRPKKYGDYARNEVSGPDGGPVEGRIRIEIVKPMESRPADA